LAHGSGTNALFGADPKILWEDTKKWVDQIRKATPNTQQFLDDLQIDAAQLNVWYRYHFSSFFCC